MAKHIWTVLCYKGSLDKYSNQVSLLDVLEEVEVGLVEAIPEDAENAVIPFNMNLVSLWIRSDPETPESVSTRYSIVSPKGDVVLTWDHAVSLSEHMRARSFLRLAQFPFRGPGDYAFRVEMRDEESGQWNRVSEVPLRLKISLAREPDPKES